MELAESFVAREGELRTIHTTLSSRHSGGVLLTGPSGAGKSSVATEALKRFKGSGLRTATAHASVVAQRVPLGALAAVPELGITNRVRSQTPAELAKHCADTVHESGSSTPLVLMVDDAHLLDDMSLLVLERLAYSDDVFLILTARHGEAEFAMLADLARQGLLTAVPLPPLSRDDVRAVIEKTLAGQVETGLVERLYEHGEGNPLLVLELVKGSLTSKHLVLEDGMWRLRGELYPSQHVQEVVESRLQELTHDERNLLDVLAFGDKLDRSAVDKLSSLHALEELERRGLVSTKLERRQLYVTFAHPMYRDVLRSGMSGLRTQEVTRLLAEHLESAPHLTDELCMQVASLRIIGGGGDAAIMVRAAEIALLRHDLDLAIECADAAVDLDDAFESRFVRAKMFSHRGQFREADEELMICLNLASSDEQLAEAAVLRLDFLTFYQGAIHDGLRFAADVESRIEKPSLRRSLAVRRAGALLHTDGPKAVAEAVEPILADGATEVESWACMLASWAYTRLGRFADAFEISLRGERAQGAKAQSTDWYPELHSVVRCYAEAGAGDLRSVASAARLELQRARQHRAEEAVGGYSLFLASLARDCGHTEESLTHAETALATYRSLSIDVYVSDAMVHMAMALALAGRGDEALTAIAGVPQAQGSEYWYFAPEMHQALGWAYAANGLRQQAKAAFAESAAVSVRSGDLLGALTAWHGCARIGFPRIAIEPMRRIVRQSDSVLPTLRLRHVVGLATSDAEILQDVSETFGHLGADLLAAESAAAAAAALDRKGLGRAAEQWQRRATSLFRQQRGPISTVLKPQAVGELTPAETDTVRLAAAGRSNAEIATALGLSVRTIENRLQRAYVKLGVSNRHALADVDL